MIPIVTVRMSAAEATAAGALDAVVTAAVLGPPVAAAKMLPPRATAADAAPGPPNSAAASAARVKIFAGEEKIESAAAAGAAIDAGCASTISATATPALPHISHANAATVNVWSMPTITPGRASVDGIEGVVAESAPGAAMGSPAAAHAADFTARTTDDTLKQNIEAPTLVTDPKVARRAMRSELFPPPPYTGIVDAAIVIDQDAHKAAHTACASELDRAMAARTHAGAPAATGAASDTHAAAALRGGADARGEFTGHNPVTASAASAMAGGRPAPAAESAANTLVLRAAGLPRDARDTSSPLVQLPVRKRKESTRSVPRAVPVTALDADKTPKRGGACT